MHRSSRSCLFIFIVIILLSSLLGCVNSSVYLNNQTSSKSVSFNAKSQSVYSTETPEDLAPLSDDAIVYITDTGECYHRGDCGYLHSSKHAIIKSKAIARGYRPCIVFKP